MSSSPFRPRAAAFALPLLASFLLLGGCTEDPLTPAQPVSVIASGLPRLDGDLYYELWMSYPLGKVTAGAGSVTASDVEYISIGRFRVAEDGRVIPLSNSDPGFMIPAAHNPGFFRDAILTVQRVGVIEGTPGPRMLSGVIEWSNGQGFVKLELKGSDAFGPIIGDETKRYGSFVLDTPTTQDSADYARGIWFIGIDRDPFGGAITIRRGIGMPTLPFVTDNDNWSYEAWLVHHLPGGPEYISLGRFVNPARPDSTGAGSGAGPMVDAIYSAPGEDFIAGGPGGLNDGTYGVLLSLQPRGLGMVRPLISILQRDTIPTTTARLDSVTLVRTPGAPSVEVTIAQ